MDQVNENAARRKRAEEQNNSNQENIENGSENLEETPQEETTNNDDSNKDKKKKTVVDKAKERAKKKIIIAIVSSGLLVPTLFILLMVTSVAIALDLFEDSGSSSSSGGEISVDGTTYLECKGITVEGKLHDLEEYVAGVANCEMSGIINSDKEMEALKAQAIAARSYGISRSKNCSISIPDGQSAQVYSNPRCPSDAKSQKAINAANETSGMILTYNDTVVFAQYDSFYKNRDYSCNSTECSATYYKEPNHESHTITAAASDKAGFAGGHGYGMSQWSAKYMASQGKDYKEILGFFYSSGVQIKSLTAEQNESNQKTGDGTENNKGTYPSTFTSSTGKTYKNFKQYLESTSSVSWGTTWLHGTGCGLTSTTIIISGTNHDVTPSAVFDKYRASKGQNGSVSLDEILSGYNKKYIRGSYSKQQLVDKLKSGGTGMIRFNKPDNNSTPNCVINGTKWSAGSQHYVAVLGYRESDNSIYISNPGQNDNAAHGWRKIDEIVSNNHPNCKVTVEYLID